MVGSEESLLKPSEERLLKAICKLNVDLLKKYGENT